MMPQAIAVINMETMHLLEYSLHLNLHGHHIHVCEHGPTVLTNQEHSESAPFMPSR